MTVRITVEVDYIPVKSNYEELGDDRSEQRMMEFDKQQFDNGDVGIEELIQWGIEPLTVKWEIV